MIWHDADLLVEMLDRQFAYFESLQDFRKALYHLPRLLEFLDREPRLAGTIADFKLDAKKALEEFKQTDSAVRSSLLKFWDQHEAELRELLGDRVKDEHDETHVYCSPNCYREGLAEPPEPSFPKPNRNSDLFKHTDALIHAINMWRHFAIPETKQEESAISTELHELGNKLDDVEQRYRFAWRQLQMLATTTSGPAHDRLIALVRRTNPLPVNLQVPEREGDEERESKLWLARVQYDVDEKFAHPLHDTQNRPNQEEGREIKEALEQARADAKLLHEALRLRIGIGRSRLTLVQRYAARCEGFEAKRLRELAAGDTRNAERSLTLDFARYLFDQGMLPIIDATLGGLRPDVLHVTHGEPLYVEAKQYGGSSPSAALKNAYNQVWGTWARTRKVLPCSEAFLVVFRRSGPLVVLPPEIRHQGLTLHTVLADISEDAGSREPGRTIELTGDELLPDAGKSGE